ALTFERRLARSALVEGAAVVAPAVESEEESSGEAAKNERRAMRAEEGGHFGLLSWGGMVARPFWKLDWAGNCSRCPLPRSEGALRCPTAETGSVVSFWGTHLVTPGPRPT